MRFPSALKRLWEGIKALFRYLESLMSTPWALLVALVRPVKDAVVRVARWLLAALWAIIEWIADRWSHVFQPAGGPGRDRTPTPGASGLVLLSAVLTSAVWLPLELNGVLEARPGWRFVGQWVTFCVGVAYFRYRAKSLMPGSFDGAIVAVAERFGLIWGERIGLVVAVWALWSVRPTGTLMSLCLILAVGFLAVLATPYAPRILPGELPELLEPPAPEDEPAEGVDTVRFNWRLNGSASSPAMSTSVDVVMDRYRQTKATNPKRPTNWPYPDFSRWVVGGSCPEVHQVAADVRTKSKEHGLGVLGEVTAVLAFVQAIPYSLDVNSTGEAEYWRFPIETLVDHTGDCEDTAILAMAVLRVLGHRVLPLVTHDHAAFGVEVDAPVAGHCVVLDGRQYFYCETTDEGFIVGELPDTVEAADLRACPLQTDPVLTPA